jgi:hypothetical protein
MKIKILLAAILIIGTINLFCQIINVPEDQPTIQAGIDFAANGDTVLVAQGTYFENINFNGKAITLASHYIIEQDSAHIYNTIIDGSQPEDPNYGSVVTFESGEDTTSVIMGFIITGGTGTFVPALPLTTGGGIACNNSGATVQNNHIINNSIITNYIGRGAGISTGPPDMDFFVIIRNNRISDNYISANGIASSGGIEFICNGLIANNEIIDNTVESSEEYANAGGLYCGGTDESTNVDIRGNYIYGNKVFSLSSGEVCCQGGGMFIYKNIGVISHNIIEGNYLNGETICRGAGVMLAVVNDLLIFENNCISNNYFEEGECWGGGIHIFGGSPTLINNVISQNEASIGGGLYIDSNLDDPIQIINNTITENTVTEYSGGMYLY